MLPILAHYHSRLTSKTVRLELLNSDHQISLPLLCVVLVWVCTCVGAEKMKCVANEKTEHWTEGQINEIFNLFIFLLKKFSNRNLEKIDVCIDCILLKHSRS